jgi:hypothetical protein
VPTYLVKAYAESRDYETWDREVEVEADSIDEAVSSVPPPPQGQLKGKDIRKVILSIEEKG